MTSNVDFFRNILDEPSGDLLAQQPDLLQPLHDLAQALREKGVGAEVTSSPVDPQKYHLHLWPLHRPGWRTSLLSIRLLRDHGVLLGPRPFAFPDEQALRNGLAHLLKQDDFKLLLEQLRAEVHKPVDGRLERANGMAILIQISPEQQKTLDGLKEGKLYDLKVELEKGEPTPNTTENRILDTAGVRFQIHQIQVDGSKVSLTVSKLPQGDAPD